MQALKVNSKIMLTNNLSIAPGAIIIITEAYIDIKKIKEDLIPAQIITEVYNSLEDYKKGKSKIDQIKDFSTSFLNLRMSYDDYQTAPTEDLLLITVKDKLDIIYPGKIEFVEIWSIKILSPKISQPLKLKLRCWPKLKLKRKKELNNVLLKFKYC